MFETYLSTEPPAPDPSVSQAAAIISSEEEIIRTLRLVFDTEQALDICVDMKNPLSSIDLRLFKALISQAATSGKSIRLITEIDFHNIGYCKSMLLPNIQLRHLSDIAGLMVLGSGTFVGTIAFEELTTARQLVTSASEKVVQYQKKMFKELWNIAIPAPVRVSNLETGESQGTTELLQNPVSIEDAYLRTLEAATSQISLMLPTTNAFKRQFSLGLAELIKRVAAKGVEVRMLLPANEHIRNELKQFERIKKIKVYFIEQSLNSRSTIVLVDRKLSLVVEIKDDSQEIFKKAIGFATLSTVKSTVKSYSSLFDNYWSHAESFEKLQRADKLKDEFINIAAHELRTPIMPIVGIVEVMMGRLGDPSQQEIRQDMEIIYRNADRLKRLAEDILNVSRIESGNFRLDIIECDIYTVIEETIQEIRGSFAYWSRKQQLQVAKASVAANAYSNSASSNSSVSTPAASADGTGSLYSMIMNIIGETGTHPSASHDEIIVFKPGYQQATQDTSEGFARPAKQHDAASSRGSLWVRCDPKKVKQVLYNLFSNALKFSDFNSGSKIFVGAVMTDAGHVKITIKDRGMGIDATIMDRMFERFASKSESGTGLGLYISKRIVDAHGGSIGAENNIDGRGATFWFMLPISPFSSISFESNESIDRLSILQREIEDRRTSLSQMRTQALQKITDMKNKLLDARDRAVKSRDSAIEEYQKKVEASRGLMRVRQELLNEQINYNSMRREIDKRVEKGLEGLTLAIENLRGDLAGDEALDKLALSESYATTVNAEAQRIIDSEFFKSIQKQLGIEESSGNERAKVNK